MKESHFMWKKISYYTVIAALIGATSLLPSLAQAQGVSITAFKPNGINVASDIGTVGSNAVAIAFIAAAVIALAFLILGAIGFITAGGDSGKLESARGKMVFAAIGLILIGATWAIFMLITQIAFGTSDVSVPTLSGGTAGSSTSDAETQCITDRKCEQEDTDAKKKSCKLKCCQEACTTGTTTDITNCKNACTAKYP